MSKKKEIYEGEEKEDVISKNSEILFLYDAKMCNPNGDIDDENKPRMDKEREINIVSDVRLKRYIRDYFKIYENETIFVDSDAKDAKDKIKKLDKDGINVRELIDVVYFGGVFTEEGIAGSQANMTGPIQFNWGYSLNKVELVESKTITSKWSGQGGIGKDFRVKYSLIAFSGMVNAKIAKENSKYQKDVYLTEEYLKRFDKALLVSIPLMATRSKIGQAPRLYIRVELKDDNHSLKDLGDFLTLENFRPLAFEEVILHIDELINYLNENKNKISKIYLWGDERLNLKHNNKIVPIEKLNEYLDKDVTVVNLKIEKL